MIEEPEVNLVLDHAIREEDEAVAEVTTSAGEVTAVQWSVENAAVATVQADNDDVTKAVVTGVAEGKTTVTADVKVTVEGKEFTVQAEANLRVVKKDALIVKATIESAPTELALAETAGISVSVDTGTIESVTWAIEGTAATIETDGVEAVITAKELGEVTVSVTVTVKSGEKTATDTATAKIEITPITYVIGKDVEIPASAGVNDWFAVVLDKSIRVKKTDIVEAVFSMKTGSDMVNNRTSKIVIALSTNADISQPYQIQEKAVLRSEEGAAGKLGFKLQPSHFITNYAEIKSFALRNITEDRTEEDIVTLEKILITPTDEVALSVSAPGAAEVNIPATINVEVDEGYVLEYKTSDAEVATVEANPEDQTQGIVTGHKAGEVTITVVVKDADGKVVKEQEVTLTVSEAYKDQDIKIDLGTAVRAVANGSGELNQVKDSNGKVTAVTVNNETEGMSISLPNKLVQGEKIQVTVKGSFAAGATGFRIYTSPSGIMGGSTNNNLGMLGDQVKEGDFVLDSLELEAAQECPTLCFRIPSYGAQIKGLTITEISIKYVS